MAIWDEICAVIMIANFFGLMAEGALADEAFSDLIANGSSHASIKHMYAEVEKLVRLQREVYSSWLL